MIPLADTKVIYVGDGKTTVFPFTFKYAESGDVKASIYDIENDTTTVLDKDYYVDENLGAVIYPGYPPGEEIPEMERPAVLDSGHKIVIYRSTEISQPIDLGDKHPLNILEKMQDRAIMLLQELNEVVERAVKVAAGAEVTPDEIITNIKKNSAAAAASASAAARSELSASEFAEQAGSRIDEIAGYAKEAENSKNQTIGYAALIMGRAAEIWKPDKYYGESAVVVYEDGYIYQCKGDSAPGTLPPDSDLWVKIKVALDDYFTMDDNCYLTLSENPTFSNMFTFNQTGYIILKEA